MNLINGIGLAGWQTRMKTAAVAVGVVSMAQFAASPAFALNWDNGEGLSFDLDTTLDYSVAMRASDQNSNALANINNDDGNRNFDTGDLVNNRFKIVMEGDLAYNDFGAFLRGRAFYDFAYMGSNSNDSPLTNNNMVRYGGSMLDNDEFTDKTQDRHGKDAEILDAYIYGSKEVGGNYLDIRVGRQAVSWGESLFIFNSINTAQNPLDGTAAVVPGVEVKDILLPTGQVFASYGLGDSFSLSGYYQWEWDKTRLNETGAFFGVPGNFSNDALLEAGENVIFAPGVPASLDHVSDNEAKDDGQFGIALRYVAEALDSAEFGLYFINYHEKLPTVGFHPFGGIPSPANSMLPGQLAFLDAAGYSLDYAEDVKLYGFSVGTVFGGAEIGFETTYRQDYKIATVDPRSPLFGTATDADVLQGQLSFRKIVPAVMWADNWVFAGEIGVNTVFNYDGEQVPDKDDTAGAFVLKVIPSWNGVAANLDLEVPVTFNVHPYGISPVGATFTENANAYGISFDFTYRAVYKVGLSYTMYTGAYDENSNTDRDFVGLNFKYTF